MLLHKENKESEYLFVRTYPHNVLLTIKAMRQTYSNQPPTPYPSKKIIRKEKEKNGNLEKIKLTKRH